MRQFDPIEIGRVESPSEDPSSAPRQPYDDAPPARLIFDPQYAEALADVRPNDRMVLVTWLDRASRTKLRARPGGDPNRAELGVFSTRAPYRPNPIGLHDVIVTEVDGPTLAVAALEAVNGTPILDLKPFIEPEDWR